MPCKTKKMIKVELEGATESVRKLENRLNSQRRKFQSDLNKKEADIIELRKTIEANQESIEKWKGMIIEQHKHIAELRGEEEAAVVEIEPKNVNVWDEGHPATYNLEKDTAAYVMARLWQRQKTVRDSEAEMIKQRDTSSKVSKRALHEFRKARAMTNRLNRQLDDLPAYLEKLDKEMTEIQENILKD